MNEIVTTQNFEVMYHGKKRQIVKRYRKCRHCGLQFTTIETYEDDENTNLPEDVLPFRPAPPDTGVYRHTKKPTIPEAAGMDTSLPPEKPKASRKPKRK